MTTCENFETYSHEQIRHEMYDGWGPNSEGDAMAGWHELAGRLTAVRHYVDSAVSGLQASRQGAAADAATGTMIPLGFWVDEAQRLANETRKLISNQIGEFTTARYSVPEVPPEPRGWGWKDLPGIDGFTTSDQEADEAFNAEQERQARAAMSSYQNGTNEQVLSVPQFAPPPTGEPDLTILAGNRSTIGGFPGGAGGAGGGGAAPGAPTPSAGVGAGAATELTAAPTSTWSPNGSDPSMPPVGDGPGGPDPRRPAPVPLPTPLPGGPGGTPLTPVARGPRGPGSGGRPGAGLGGPGGAAGLRGGPGADGVELRPARPSGLAEALLVHVPELQRAAGNAVTIPAQLAAGDGLRADTELTRLERAGLRSDEARQVRRLLTGAMLRRFKIGAAARDRLGRRHRAPGVVSVLDTEHGRVQIRPQRGDRLLLAPTDKQRLTADVADLIRSVADTAARHR